MLNWIGICGSSSLLVCGCYHTIARIQRSVNIDQFTKLSGSCTELRYFFFNNRFFYYAIFNSYYFLNFFTVISSWNFIRCNQFHWNNYGFFNTNDCCSLHQRKSMHFLNFLSEPTVLSNTLKKPSILPVKLTKHPLFSEHNR